MFIPSSSARMRKARHFGITGVRGARKIVCIVSRVDEMAPATHPSSCRPEKLIAGSSGLIMSTRRLPVIEDSFLRKIAVKLLRK